MKKYAVLMATAVFALIAPVVNAHREDASTFNTVPVFEQSPFPAPAMPKSGQRKFNRLIRRAERRAGVRAHSSHWTYTWAQMKDNLENDTNLDRACGWSTNQYCKNDDDHAYFLNWVGEHSARAEFVWSQYTYCLPGCDVWDRCDVIVRVADHNDGGRVNVRDWYEWIHKESSCNITGPISQVP